MLERDVCRTKLPCKVLKFDMKIVGKQHETPNNVKPSCVVQYVSPALSYNLTARQTPLHIWLTHHHLGAPHSRVPISPLGFQKTKNARQELLTCISVSLFFFLSRLSLLSPVFSSFPVFLDIRSLTCAQMVMRQAFISDTREVCRHGGDRYISAIATGAFHTCWSLAAVADANPLNTETGRSDAALQPHRCSLSLRPLAGPKSPQKIQNCRFLFSLIHPFS